VENRGLRPFTLLVTGGYNRYKADVAQLVEQSIRNRQVIGSSPIVGSSKSLRILHFAVAPAATVFECVVNCVVATLHMTLSLFRPSIASLRGSSSGC
jgi:hypothetical protein